MHGDIGERCDWVKSDPIYLAYHDGTAWHELAGSASQGGITSLATGANRPALVIDDLGRPMPPGTYEWRSLNRPGFRATARSGAAQRRSGPGGGAALPGSHPASAGPAGLRIPPRRQPRPGAFRSPAACGQPGSVHRLLSGAPLSGRRHHRRRPQEWTDQHPTGPHPPPARYRQ